MRLRATLVLLATTVVAFSAQKPAPTAAQTPAATPQDSISSNSRIIPPPANYAFPAGVTLAYDVEWRLWHAGTATIKLDSAGAENRIVGLADSAGAVALLYTVH